MTADDAGVRSPRVLSVAGSDPSGGAGIQADLKTFGALGAYGMAAVTALTAQNTRGVTGVSAVDADFVTAQIDAVFADINVDAVKLGMLGGPESVHRVADCLRRHAPPFVVLDPVMVAQSGDRLVEERTVERMRDELVPLATLITPNLPEAAVLLNEEVARTTAEMEAVADRLAGLGCSAILLKGGHLGGERSPDLFCGPGGAIWLDGPRIDTANTHGTGCTLASAAAALAPVATSLEVAVRAAKRYLGECIAHADALGVGGGNGPVHHFHDPAVRALRQRLLRASRA